MKRFVILGLAAATVAFATSPYKEGPYVGPVKPYLMQDDTTDPLKLRFNYLYEFAQIAQFCADWQLDDIDSVDHGGMIEAETGELADVIQTDNTQEAIWVWARYGELTGDTERFADNIDKAWFYCDNFPAWEEEGAAGNDYYRNHNCAWGVAAEQRYRMTYGDESWLWYADSCAEYMKFHPMNIWNTVNRFVTGWCAGWLYSYGMERDDGEARDTACVLADSLLTFIEPQIEARLQDEKWAMSAGTMVWGICNSAFRRDTTRGKQWIAENGHLVDTFQTWYANDYYSWDNSWNVGFANGQGAMYDISHDETYARHHRWLTHKLLSYDTDDDGGIMATTQDDDTTDMTWVSLYVCMMGLDRLIGEVRDYDAGALEIVGLHDGDQIEAGTIMDIQAVVSNYGKNALTGVDVSLSGDASGSGNSDLEFLTSDTLILATNWTVTDSAVLVLTTNHDLDQNPANDTYVVRLNKAAIVEGLSEEKVAEPSLCLDIAHLTGPRCRIRYAIPASSAGMLEIFDVRGALVRREPLNESDGELLLNLDELPRGVYYVRLNAEKRGATDRFILMY